MITHIVHPANRRVFVFLSHAHSLTHSIAYFSISSIMINVAMEAEAQPFIDHVGATLVPDFFPSAAPFLAYRGASGGATITIITNGKDSSVYGTGVDNVGTLAAGTATFLALQTAAPPDVLINAGTCGGFARKGAAIGDVFLTTGVAFHDRRIPLPGFDMYGVGKLETAASLDVAKMAESLSYKTGIVTTSDSLDATEECKQRMLENDASVKDMEAAAIAWSAKLHNVPLLGVKVVTDIVDGDRPTQEEFLENLGTAARQLQAALPKVVEYLSTKKGGSDEL